MMNMGNDVDKEEEDEEEEGGEGEGEGEDMVINSDDVDDDGFSFVLPPNYIINPDGTSSEPPPPPVLYPLFGQHRNIINDDSNKYSMAPPRPQLKKLFAVEKQDDPADHVVGPYCRWTGRKVKPAAHDDDDDHEKSTRNFFSLRRFRAAGPTKKLLKTDDINNKSKNKNNNHTLFFLNCASKADQNYNVKQGGKTSKAVNDHQKAARINTGRRFGRAGVGKMSM